MSLRVTGGVHRSRHLVVPRGTATRPTSDRVREALFSILAGDDEAPLEGARVLDLYAGTGALGIEALSRGAAHAVFVERAPAPLAALRANLAALGLGDAASSTVVAAPVARAVKSALPAIVRSGGPFTVVLCDPPYALVESGEVARDLAEAAPLLAPRARVVLEHATGDTAPALEASGMSLDGSRTYGDTTLALYRFVSLPSP